ncbi:MAG: adenine deaminase C-terminal domain-containing protein, partial [Acidimicrobiales bacterium]
VDGHAPGLSGRTLDAYLAAGIESDHECTSYGEAVEKRRKAMWIFIRQGSASQNLADLVPTVIEHGTDRVAFCTDDREPDTLLTVGHVNDCVRLAVSLGVRMEDALVLATSNPADYHHFDHLGWIAPGYQADILAFDDLSSLEPTRVWQKGRLVAAGGVTLDEAVVSSPPPAWMRSSVHLPTPPPPSAFELDPPRGGRTNVIGVKSRTLSTTHIVLDFAQHEADLARIAVVERHRETGRIGLGYVHGFGLRRGAIASTVAHDAHNCMVVGSIGRDGPGEMSVAVARLAEIGGGQVAVLDGQVIAEVALPIGGLVSDRPAAAVAEEVAGLARAAAQTLEVEIAAPFMQLSFLGLSVLPELRITDRGLVDVMAFELTDIGAS